jgi:crossover junction endodeoxyribonuclease RuvC
MSRSPSAPDVVPLARSEPPRILGVDPGLQVTGYAVLEVRPRGPFVREAGVVRPDCGADADLSIRVRYLYDDIVGVLAQYQPSVMALEQLFAHYEHPRTAILMAHARGVLLLAAAQRGVPVVNYPTTRVKKTITGNGRATKEQIQHAMLRELNLPRLPEPHDVADALAIALCHYYVGYRGETRVSG